MTRPGIPFKLHSPHAIGLTAAAGVRYGLGMLSVAIRMTMAMCTLGGAVSTFGA